jgi:hypothetical protein
MKYRRPLRDVHQTWGGYLPVWQRQGSTERLNWLKDYRKTYLERDIADVGLVVYNGDEISEIRKNVWAVPDWMLFGSL